MLGFLKKFAKDASGNVAVLGGVLAVPLLMSAGVAADYAMMANIEKQLQSAADAAALTSTRELALTSNSNETVTGIAKNYITASLTDIGTHEVLVDVQISAQRDSVTVNLDYVWQPMVVHYIDKSALPIKVNATASLAGSESICVIALDDKNPSALAMTGASSLTANNCAVYSNSSSGSGISTVTKSMLASTSTYSGGGYSGSLSTYNPTPVTDSTAIPDPLIDRQPPSVSQCDFQNLPKLDQPSITLTPGTYCGGISVVGETVVTLQPGIYVMKDGPLSVQGNATLQGNNVGFYFTGASSTFDFGVSTQANLSAPKSGQLAGILFFEDRNSSLGRDFTIRSKDAEKFEGTVYLPRGRFVVDKASRIGQASNWTAIVARQIEIKKGPDLVINSDYAGSDIPVPDGIGSKGNVRLTK